MRLQPFELKHIPGVTVGGSARILDIDPAKGWKVCILLGIVDKPAPPAAAAAPIVGNQGGLHVVRSTSSFCILDEVTPSQWDKPNVGPLCPEVVKIG